MRRRPDQGRRGYFSRNAPSQSQTTASVDVVFSVTGTAASTRGEGGMGAVYRATDTSLGRQVAIKVLPDALAQDAERLARFERKAKTLAALNHPHIAAIYGFERSSATPAVVMELDDRKHWKHQGRSGANGGDGSHATERITLFTSWPRGRYPDDPTRR